MRRTRKEPTWKIPQLKGLPSEPCPFEELDDAALDKVKNGTVLVLTRNHEPVGVIVPIIKE
jgi:hypothetical protein